MTGVLKEHLYVKTVGKKTFGKGVGQISMLGPLESYMNFTVYEMVLPSGEHYHEKGIKPGYDISTSSGQMISALNIAGLKEFDIHIRECGVIINGQEPTFLDFGLQARAGKTYFPIDFLNAPFLMKYTYDEKSNKVNMKDSQGKQLQLFLYKR